MKTRQTPKVKKPGAEKRTKEKREAEWLAKLRKEDEEILLLLH